MEKKNFTEVINQLLIIQERDTRIMRCQVELQAIPRRKQEIAAARDGNRGAADQAKDTLKAKQVAVKQSEVEIETCRQQVAKLREQQFQIKSNEEYKALNNEIGHIQAKMAELEDRALALMEEAERAQTDLARAKTDLDAGETRLAAELQKLDERRRNLEAEIQQIQKEHDALAAPLDAAIIKRYNRVIENKRDAAVVPVENNACGGCHMNLQAQVIQDAKKAANLVFCSFCGRILYWTR